MLNPIPKTPLRNQPPLAYEEAVRTVALMRFALPTAEIRLACGRLAMPDAGAALLRAGANGTISGNMLTTPSYSIAADRALAAEEGFCVAPRFA